MKFRTVFEIVTIGSLLFYCFGLEPTKKYYNDTKKYVSSYVDKFVNKTENTGEKYTGTIEPASVHNSSIVYTDSIPFKYENNQIKLKIYVDDIPVNGILDTGAMSGVSLSYAEYEFFRRQGIKIGKLTKNHAYGISGQPVTIYQGYLHNVRIGSIILDKIDVDYMEVVDDSNGDPQDNLFGINIFNKRFTVDYEANMIYFY